MNITLKIQIEKNKVTKIHSREQNIGNKIMINLSKRTFVIRS